MLEVHELLMRLAERQAAIGEAQRALHRLVELGLVRGGAGGAVAAHGSVEAMAGTGGVPATVTNAAGVSPGRATAAKQCAACGELYQPDPRPGDRAKWCSNCRRTLTVAARRKIELERAEREAAERKSGNGESRDPMQTIRGWKPWPDPAVT